jgi:hypothetical protein
VTYLSQVFIPNSSVYVLHIVSPERNRPLFKQLPSEQQDGFLHIHHNSNGGTKAQYEYFVTNFSVHLSQEMAVHVLDRCM